MDYTFVFTKYSGRYLARSRRFGLTLYASTPLTLVYFLDQSGKAKFHHLYLQWKSSGSWLHLFFRAHVLVPRLASNLVVNILGTRVAQKFYVGLCKYPHRFCNCLVLWNSKWTASSGKVLLNMRKMLRFRSSCACAEYLPGLCFLFIYSVVSNNSASGQWMPWSDCADAQADLGFRWPHTN